MPKCHIPPRSTPVSFKKKSLGFLPVQTQLSCASRFHHGSKQNLTRRNPAVSLKKPNVWAGSSNIFHLSLSVTAADAAKLLLTLLLADAPSTILPWVSLPWLQPACRCVCGPWQQDGRSNASASPFSMASCGRKSAGLTSQRPGSSTRDSQSGYLRNQPLTVIVSLLLWRHYTSSFRRGSLFTLLPRAPSHARSLHVNKRASLKGSQQSCKYWWTMTSDEVTFSKHPHW